MGAGGSDARLPHSPDALLHLPARLRLGPHRLRSEASEQPLHEERPPVVLAGCRVPPALREEQVLQKKVDAGPEPKLTGGCRPEARGATQ